MTLQVLCNMSSFLTVFFHLYTKLNILFYPAKSFKIVNTDINFSSSLHQISIYFIQYILYILYILLVSICGYGSM